MLILPYLHINITDSSLELSYFLSHDFFLSYKSSYLSNCVIFLQLICLVPFSHPFSFTVLQSQCFLRAHFFFFLLKIFPLFSYQPQFPLPSLLLFPPHNPATPLQSPFRKGKASHGHSMAHQVEVALNSFPLYKGWAMQSSM